MERSSSLDQFRHLLRIVTNAGRMATQVWPDRSHEGEPLDAAWQRIYREPMPKPALRCTLGVVTISQWDRGRVLLEHEGGASYLCQLRVEGAAPSILERQALRLRGAIGQAVVGAFGRALGLDGLPKDCDW
jgi:hypothetical protein